MPATVPRNGGLTAQRRTAPSLPNVTIACAGPSTLPLRHRATALVVASSACFAARASKADAGDVDAGEGGLSTTGGAEDAEAVSNAETVAVAEAVAVVAVAVAAVGGLGAATECHPDW